MNIFTVENVKKSYGLRVLFDDVTFAIDGGQKLGLIGLNGAGKTTLLKIIAGLTDTDSGTIWRNPKARIHYLPQEPQFVPGHTVLESVLDGDLPVMKLLQRYEEAVQRDDDAAVVALSAEMDEQQAWELEAHAKIILSKLGISNFSQSVDELSGGQRKRLGLARALIMPCDLLIMDEPTNHLDDKTIMWLEEYLRDSKAAILLSTHDRYFLDNICTKIWEVSFQTMTTYKGNFSTYLPQKEAADALRQKQHDADVALAEKLQDYVDRNLVRASTTKMAQSRRRQLEKLEITEAPKDETNQLKFRFEYDVEPWNELVLLKNLTIKIGERTLLEPFTYTVCRGQRLIIAGPNGAGKSTLMQVLDGKRRPSGGMVRLGTGARPSIFAQQQNRLGQGRVIDVIWNKYPRMTELEVRSHLAKLGFRGDTVFKPCEALSGGELARLRFAEIVLERPNLLFLDEPTNHLDIYTRENLTEALMAYTGTLLLVTHDRYLMQTLGCPILYLEDGKAVLYPSYDALMGRAAPAPTAQKEAAPAKAGYGKEQRRRRAELRAKIKACEDEMEACGAREVELDNEINSPEVYNDPDLLRQKSDELSDLRFHQDELFAAWEAAVEEQEQYEQTAGGEE